ncbi:MAG: neutral/alkaline non-lysosomal ceramidase N-terminal domain-containing protein, partial [Nannocystaceae bacterium]
AYRSRKPVQAKWSSSIVDGIARNRSFKPFLANPEAREILHQSDQWGISKCAPIEHPPAGTNPDPLRCRAVYPKLGVLSLVANSDELVASAAFVAVHPTVMPNDVNLYHGDFFGVATRVAEQHLGAQSRTNNAPPPVVALFNGAQGDVSPAWVRHDHSEALRLGSLLASAIVDSSNRAGMAPGTKIVNRYREVQIADVHTSGGKTSNRPIPGKGQLGGAEDHRTVWHKRGYREGVVSSRERYRGQGNKRPALPIALLALGVPKGALPDHAPLAVHRFGHLVFTGVPGEITTTLGRRIRENITRVPGDVPVLIGLANEYLAYFTTPEEYALQHYEGASMLYGPHTAEVLLRGTGALADPRTTYHGPEKPSFSHHPGPRVHRSKPSMKMGRKLGSGPAKLSGVFPIENV